MGPLRGVKVLEFAGLGPAPFCTMLLSDMGAEVIRIDKTGSKGAGKSEILARGRRSIALNLKDKQGQAIAFKLIADADILIEGFRPGVMERLGLGPEDALKINSKLIYGRMTGWGQDGPLAERAGHDINYIALTGALHAIGPKDQSIPPLNLVGDFGGGALYLAMGILAALHHAATTGEGQVVDAAIVDGVTSLLSAQHQLMAQDVWSDTRQDNWLDGGAPFYGTYLCADGKEVAIGPLEPEFYHILLEGLGLSDHPDLQAPYDKSTWERARAALEEVFKTKTRDEWAHHFENTDACLAPVLSFAESQNHPHMKARGCYETLDGITQSGAMPRFSHTPGKVQSSAEIPGFSTQTVLQELGMSFEEITRMKQAGIVG